MENITKSGAGLLCALIILFLALPAAANDKCRTINLVQAPWAGLSAKTETAAWMLRKLGYKTHVQSMNLALLYKSLEQNQNDAFLGLWLPDNEQQVIKGMKDGSLNLLTVNVKGVKQGLAVPDYVYNAGVKSLADLHKYKSKFGGKIYVLSHGNPINQWVENLISENRYDLGDWGTINSATAVMVAAVKEHVKQKKWVVFIGWKPHPMNLKMHIRYLQDGGIGGVSQGKAIYTITREGYPWQCPNIGQFLANYRYTIEEESKLIDYVSNKGMKPVAAGLKLIKDNQELLNQWFQTGGPYQVGPIKTADGNKDALDVVKKMLSE